MGVVEQNERERRPTNLKNREIFAFFFFLRQRTEVGGPTRPSLLWQQQTWRRYASFSLESFFSGFTFLSGTVK